MFFQILSYADEEFHVNGILHLVALRKKSKIAQKSLSRYIALLKSQAIMQFSCISTSIKPLKSHLRVMKVML